jgi:hypothetical protein
MAVLLSLAALTSCRSDEVGTAQCRQQFAGYQHVLSENGNPGSKDFTPRLTARWKALDAEFRRLASSATADDCPAKFRTMKARVKRVESVLSKIDDYDVDRMIRKVESYVEHSAELSTAARRDYVLIMTLRTLRESGAAAQKSLASYVAAVDAVDPDKYSALSAAMVELYNAAASDAAFADFKDALDTVKNYEPRQS